MSEPAISPFASFARSQGKQIVVVAACLCAVVFALIITASYRQSPDLSGILTGIFVGIFTSLLLLLGILSLLVWLVMPKRVPPPIDLALSDQLNALLAPTLLDLESARAEVRSKVASRALIRVPLCGAAGLAIWLIGEYSKPQNDIFGLFSLVFLGGAAGYVWSAHKLSESYRRLYKDRVLPQLAARFGGLVYRRAETVSVGALATHRIFKDFEDVVAEDEIAGTYRGLPVSITEVCLSKGAGEDRTTSFDGLLTQITLPRHLSGTTVVFSDGGFAADIKDRFRRTELSPVRLEDADFDRRYRVYSSDQIQARALLTPAFVQRLMALAGSTRFQLPGILAEDNRLIVAMPKGSARNLFEPPDFKSPAGGTVLVDLTKDIENVLQVADAIIDLDFFARTSALAAERAVSSRSVR